MTTEELRELLLADEEQSGSSGESSSGSEQVVVHVGTTGEEVVVLSIDDLEKILLSDKNALSVWITDDPVWRGRDGISVTHSWNGTVLTITSASGTSSADLKGGTAAVYTSTIPVNGWVGEQVPYTCQITCTGATASTTPVIGMDKPDTLSGEDYEAAIGAMACLDRAVASEGAITFYCYREKPESDINLRIIVIEGGGSNGECLLVKGGGGGEGTVPITEEQIASLFLTEGSGRTEQGVFGYIKDLIGISMDENSNVFIYSDDPDIARRFVYDPEGNFWYVPRTSTTEEQA